MRSKLFSVISLSLVLASLVFMAKPVSAAPLQNSPPARVTVDLDANLRAGLGMAQPTGDTVRVTVKSAANLRGGPGTTFAIVGSAKPSQTLVLKGRNQAGDWFQIANNSWIYGNLISAKPMQLPVVTVEPSTAPPPAPRLTTVPRAAVAPAPAANCDPSYPDVCIPSGPDLDCGEISYRRFRVIGSDPHGFDRDNDGIGCES